MPPASGVRNVTSGHRALSRESRMLELVSRDRCPAILKNRETRQSSRCTPCDYRYPLAPYCSSRLDKSPSWASSSRPLAARQAHYGPSAEDGLHYHPCRATLSPPPLQMAVISPILDVAQIVFGLAANRPSPSLPPAFSGRHGNAEMRLLLWQHACCYEKPKRLKLVVRQKHAGGDRIGVLPD